MLNAFVAFYRRLLKQEEKVNVLKRPKKVQQLPNVFSKGEVTRLIKCIENDKHKAIIALVYAAGLRRIEVLNLRKMDILFERKCIFVKAGKGKKDRYVLLAQKIEILLKRYFITYRPKYWLFEGVKGGQYSERSIQQIFTNAKIKAKVNPYVTLHGLRHIPIAIGIATHLVEDGVPLHVVKDLLGHKFIKTAKIYLHISNKFRQQLQSPLDGLDI